MDIFTLDSDFEKYTTESSDSDEFEFDGRKTNFKSHAKSIITSIDLSLSKLDDILFFERVFSHGDIVSLSTDPTGQLGKVIDLDVAVDLEVLSGDLVKKVNSKTLARVRAFQTGDYVVLGSWIGRVTGVFDLVYVIFDDGTKSEILVTDPSILVPISDSRYEEIPNFYHPGQRVRVGDDGADTATKTANWLCGDWGVKYNKNEGVICKIEIGSVKIQWILSASQVWGGNYMSTPPLVPNSLQDPKSITLLSCFQHANWQLGDWCTVLDANRTAPKRGSIRMEKNVHGRYGRGYRDEICMVSKTKTLITVLWQNGAVLGQLDPQSLTPITNLGDHDFFPGQFVLEKEAGSSKHNGKKIGVVRNVDASERTVRVNWLGKNWRALFGDSNEEIVSAYELVEDPDFMYCVGEIVVKMVPNCEKINEKGKEREQEQEQEKEKEKEESNFDFLSCFGNFVGYKDGQIEVKWANGVLSKVDPLEICGLQRLVEIMPPQPINEVPVNPNSNTGTGTGTSDGTELAEQEKQVVNEDVKPVDQFSEDYVGSLKKKMALDLASDDCYLGSLKKVTLRLLPKTTFDFLTGFTFTLFGTTGSSASGSGKEPSYQIVKQTELDSNIDQSTHSEPIDEKTEMPLEEPEDSEEKTELPLLESKEITKMPLDNEREKGFKRFDVLDQCSDHYFIDQISEESQVKRVWLKKIQREWSILQNNLPESIYVRAYEERMDLLRACIIGPAGTPYHDGLFFFDILFPPNYPQEPPTVHYHSGGLRLNPNLYESGKVCLSLLKTWTGTGTETWDPQNSTILQVLLSLQALVLNEKPYFNEAGFDKQVGRAESEKNSVNYNENAFLLSCKSMMYIINKPPKNFEDLVKEHFTCRSPHILNTCKSYLDGAQFGPGCNNTKILGETSKSCSTGFKLMLAKLVPKLVSAFSEMDIRCDPLVQLKDN